jgi:hypothetical protein
MERNLSQYEKVYDEKSPNWNHEELYNLMFLKATSSHVNDILTVRGHVFLNEVYDALGFPRTPEGQLVGWIKDGDGDGVIDFGIQDDKTPYQLDFNVDGVIYDKI